MSATRMAVLKPSLALKAKLYRGFADRSRLAILEALADGPRSVGEIVVTTGLQQSNVSNHLTCLFDCGLVTREQQGRYVYYQLSDPSIVTLLALADEVLGDVAGGVEECPRYATSPEVADRRPFAGA